MLLLQTQLDLDPEMIEIRDHRESLDSNQVAFVVTASRDSEVFGTVWLFCCCHLLPELGATSRTQHIILAYYCCVDGAETKDTN